MLSRGNSAPRKGSVIFPPLEMLVQLAGPPQHRPPPLPAWAQGQGVGDNNFTVTPLPVWALWLEGCEKEKEYVCLARWAREGAPGMGVMTVDGEIISPGL